MSQGGGNPGRWVPEKKPGSTGGSSQTGGTGTGSSVTPGTGSSAPTPPQWQSARPTGTQQSQQPQQTGGTGGTGGTDENDKLESGMSKHRTIFKLLPVNYRISIIYLGDKRVRHAPPATSRGYHCKFQLKRGLAPLDPLDVIPNIITHGKDPNPDTDPISLSLENGGDNRNPTGGEAGFRVSVLDNHALRDDDVDLVGGGGDAKSKVESYTEREFTYDIYPDVPLRVVVRKYEGNDPVSLNPDELRILWEIKDPAEELDRTVDARAKAFVTDIIKKERRVEGTDGADNCATDLKGKRDTRASASTPGIPAERVLFEVPYNPVPPVDRIVLPPDSTGTGTPPSPPSLDNVIDHPNPPTPVTMKGNLQGLSTLTGVEEQAGDERVTVGVSDVLFIPPPVGGDNYRFLVALTDAGGTDVRTLEDKNRSIYLQDHLRRNIPHPHFYVTARFTVWRRIDVRLQVWTNKLTADPVGWGAVRSSYAQAFVELVGPIDRKELTFEGWRRQIKDYMRDEGIQVPGINLPNRFKRKDFKQWFWPVFMRNVPNGWNPPRYNQWVAQFQADNGRPPNANERKAYRQAQWEDKLDWDFTAGIARRSIAKVCTDEGIPAPGRSSRQMNSEGFYMFLTQRAFPNATSLGMYLAEQQFFMRGVPSPTVTFAHELGHGLYLRHGITSLFIDDAVFLMNADNTNERVFLYSLKRDCYPLDHDHKNTVDCIMSYDNDTITTNFCGGCLFHLRFYDFKVFRNKYTNPGLSSGWDPAKIRRFRNVNLTGGGTANGWYESFPDLAKGQKYLLLTIGNLEPTLNDCNAKAAKVLDTLDNARYTVEPAGQGVTVSRGANETYWHVDAAGTATPGEYTVKFMHGTSERARVTIKVV